MNGTGKTVENAFEELVRRVLKEELGAINAELNTHGGLLLSAKVAAERLCVPESKVRDMARKGELPCVRIGYYVRFQPEDLDQYVRDHRK